MKTDVTQQTDQISVTRTKTSEKINTNSKQGRMISDSTQESSYTLEDGYEPVYKDD